MYYVIQSLEGIKNKHFVSYSVPKYRYSEKNENIIFEFGEKPNIKRKWAKKSEIVLLTTDKIYFANFLKKLKTTEETFLKHIDEQEQKVNQLYKELESKMNEELLHVQNDKNSPSLI